MNITTIRSITKCYDKLSNLGKILILMALMLMVVAICKSFFTIKVEGMTNNNAFVFKQGSAAYDEFYANIYDHLVFNQIKNDYEIGVIVNVSSPNEKSVIADIGCGTGHHVADLNSQHLEVIGIDISPSMIDHAQKKYPALKSNFKVGDGLNGSLFVEESLTHVLCMYFTIYYMKDKERFLYNCMNWLMPGGYLIVHLVDREKFDPILPPGNPLYIVSPQKYAKERITKTKVTFNDFVYNADFKLNTDNTEDNVAIFDEKFKFNDGHVRKQEQTLYIEDLSTIISIAQEVGFIIHSKIDMVKCAYEYQYLYVFTKPS